MEKRTPLRHSLLTLSECKNSVILQFEPVEEEVTLQSLTQLFQSSVYHQFKLKPEVLNEAVLCFMRLQTNQLVSEELTSIVIAEREHAQLTINVDSLKMNAKAVIITAYGGLAITYEQFKSEMERLSITQGLIRKNIILLLEKSKLAKPGASLQATIAKGREPIHGTNSIFKRLVETPLERLLRPQKNKDGSVDMRNLGKLITVSPGTEIMRKIPHNEGCVGIKITGDIVQHKPGKDIPLQVGENTQLSEDDENLLIASLNGIPKAISNGMKVDDVLIIDGVNVGGGHVDYKGSVIIEGDVCDGMQVKASGDITISGFVESAQLECGGDLVVGKGIIGHKREMKNNSYSCELNVKGSVTALFCQYSKIVAGMGVNIKKELLHCDVNSQGDINVIDERGLKGTIIGGSLSAFGSVKTVTLGALCGSKTVIDLVGSYSLLLENKKLINCAIQTEVENLNSLIEAQRKMDSLPHSEKKQTLEGQLTSAAEQVQDKLSELETNLVNKSAEITDYFEQTKVISQKEMLNDVYINIGQEKFRSTRDYGPTKVSIKNNKIIAEPYKK